VLRLPCACYVGVISKYHDTFVMSNKNTILQLLSFVSHGHQ